MPDPDPTDQQLAAFPVSHAADVLAARREVTRLAADLGFADAAVAEIALVVSELGSNLVKYAGEGTLAVVRTSREGQVGIRVESHDTGPGIPNVDLALRDGYSTGGSLGTGLGAVNRLMDSLEISSLPHIQTRIRASRWVRRLTPAPTRCPLEVGVASLPKLGEADNGDTFVVKSWSTYLLVGVIDGLGHGEPARRAAQAARAYVESHFDQPLTGIFRGTGIACRATRGAVMALARFDWERERVELACVGNIEIRAVDYPGRFSLMIRRGIVGLNAPDPKVNELAWPASATLVMHSDGISTHWRWDEVAHLADRPAGPMAHALLRALARPQDDSTVLVVKAAPPQGQP